MRHCKVRPYFSHAVRVQYTTDLFFRPIDQRPFNKELVSLEDLRIEENRGQDKRRTVTSSWDRATFSRAVFSMAFNYKPGESPGRSNQWYLEDNAWYVDYL